MSEGPYRAEGNHLDYSGNSLLLNTREAEIANAAYRAGAESMRARTVVFLKSITQEHPELCYAADDADWGFDEEKVIEAVATLPLVEPS